ncbi:MAG: Bax inhibitor-1/YccA family protein [Pleurocapsa minor GSE-CHR-MK-17-07R]|jgi:FtsH-binding integral membrane protein|nr:Bax inhibitor-1/YccA family protein [Pleurocapsa minor GSE-CHR-MK 17-07R]
MSFRYTSLSTNPVRGDSVPYADAHAFIKWVFAWMGLGLLVTTIVGYFVSTNEGLQLQIARNPVLLFGALIAEIVLVMVLSWAMGRLSPTLAAALFLIYAALNGVTLSFITLVYAESTIVTALITATILFATLAVFGFTTSIDLSQFRGLLIVGVIGVGVALLVNIFLRSDTFGFLISIVGVIVFLGLTAWDTQAIKHMAVSPEVRDNPANASKYAIYGALKLYLDFINLFLFILRILGRRR